MIPLKFTCFSKSRTLFFGATVCCLAASAQPSAFTQPANGWMPVGGVTVHLSKPEMLVTSAGDGILAHVPKKRSHAADLVTTMAYGDMELELSYLLASGTEAALYLHDAYPIFLADSRDNRVPTAHTNGGTPGHAPRQEVGRAPGLWQRLLIRFQAPRFDGAGRETAPARLLRAELNGVVIHEDVQLETPGNTNGKPEAPVRLTANQGQLALKDLKIRKLPPPATQQANSPDPILLDALVNTTLRSFMDIPGGTRVVHAISAGHPEHVHYTYDLDHGSLFQVWRGGFLDATPMWYNRGNGTSTVMGSRLVLEVPGLAIGKLAAADDVWPTDTAGSGYKPNGYVLDQWDRPTFRYKIYGGQVEDAIRPLPDGTGLTRTISVSGDPTGLYVRLAAAPVITDQGKGVFLIGDNAWYLKLEEAGKAKPIVRTQPNGAELLVPMNNTIRYSIIF